MRKRWKPCCGLEPLQLAHNFLRRCVLGGDDSLSQVDAQSHGQRDEEFLGSTSREHSDGLSL